MLKNVLLVCVIAMIAFSYASAILINSEARRADYIAAHLDALDAETTAAIREGVLIVGMEPAEVVAAIGEPWDTKRFNRRWTIEGFGICERWQMFPPHHDRHHTFYLVYFEHGRVTGWQSR